MNMATRGVVAVLALFGASAAVAEGDTRERIRTLEERMNEREQREGSGKVYWKNGLRIEGAGYKIKVGGRIKNDYAWIIENDEVKLAVGD